MAKGYWIGRVDVERPRRLQALYRRQRIAIFKKFGGRFWCAAASS